MASEKIQNLDSSNFEAAVTGSDCPVLVDFWAPWCGPCKAIAPILEELAEEMDGKVKICKIDVDQNSEIAGKYNVRAIPTMVLFKGGESADQIVGLAQKAEIKSKIESLA